MIAPTNQSNPTNRSKVHVFPHFFINRYDNISSSFICLLYNAPVQDSAYSACDSVWFGRRYRKMDWNRSKYDNFTGNLEYCETFLGTIETWNLTVYLSILVIAAIANVLLLLAIYKNPLKCFRRIISSRT